MKIPFSIYFLMTPIRRQPVMFNLSSGRIKVAALIGCDQHPVFTLIILSITEYRFLPDGPFAAGVVLVLTFRLSCVGNKQSHHASRRAGGLEELALAD